MHPLSPVAAFSLSLASLRAIGLPLSAYLSPCESPIRQVVGNAVSLGPLREDIYKKMDLTPAAAAEQVRARHGSEQRFEHSRSCAPSSSCRARRVALHSYLVGAAVLRCNGETVLSSQTDASRQ